MLSSTVVVRALAIATAFVQPSTGNVVQGRKVIGLPDAVAQKFFGLERGRLKIVSSFFRQLRRSRKCRTRKLPTAT